MFESLFQTLIYWFFVTAFPIWLLYVSVTIAKINAPLGIAAFLIVILMCGAFASHLRNEIRGKAGDF